MSITHRVSGLCILLSLGCSFRCYHHSTSWLAWTKWQCYYEVVSKHICDIMLVEDTYTPREYLAGAAVSVASTELTWSRDALLRIRWEGIAADCLATDYHACFYMQRPPSPAYLLTYQGRLTVRPAVRKWLNIQSTAACIDSRTSVIIGDFLCLKFWPMLLRTSKSKTFINWMDC